MSERVKLEFHAVRYGGEWFGVVRAEGEPTGARIGGISATHGFMHSSGFDSPEEVAEAIEDMLAKLRHGRIGR